MEQNTSGRNSGFPDGNRESHGREQKLASVTKAPSKVEQQPTFETMIIYESEADSGNKYRIKNDTPL